MNDPDNLPDRFAEAINRLDGDFGLLCEMAAITCEDLPEVRGKAEAAIAEGDVAETASGLHKLKGMLSTFESEGVTLEIQEMLDSARKGDIGEVRRAYEQHRGELDELICQINGLAEQSNVS